MASMLATSSSKHKYQKLRNSFQSQPSLRSKLPSWYQFLKTRHKINSFVIETENNRNDAEELDTLHLDATLSIQNGSDSRALMRGKNRIENGLERHIYGDTPPSIIVHNYAAKLDGDYEHYFDTLLEKHVTMKVLSCKDAIMTTGNIGVINSFDGAQHVNTDEGITNVTSYSALLFSNETVFNGISTAESSSILTWKQVIGKEEPCSVMASVSNHYNEKTLLKLKFNDMGYHVYMYDMHDGKMLYILSGHGMWNRKHYPFLLCKCNRAKGVNNPGHVCKMMSHSEHSSFYHESLHKWDEISKSDMAYTKKNTWTGWTRKTMGYHILVLIPMYFHFHVSDLIHST